MTVEQPPAPAPASAEPVLRVERMSVRFRMPGERHVEAVTDAGFTLAAGECLALVGESGCGKSVLASALLGLLPGNAETAGSARLADGLDLLAADEATLARTVRGRRVGLVPQSPAAHLTPVRTIRSHLEETVRELAGPSEPSGPSGARTPGTGRRARRARLRAAAKPRPPARPSPPPTSTTTRTNSPAASPNAPPPPWPSSGTPRCCSPTSRPPASTGTSSTAPWTSCGPTPVRPAGPC